jgi:hypothetical protein
LGTFGQDLLADGRNDSAQRDITGRTR